MDTAVITHVAVEAEKALTEARLNKLLCLRIAQISRRHALSDARKRRIVALIHAIRPPAKARGR